MKKYIIYIGVLVFGLLLGWLLFSSPEKPEEMHTHSEEAVVFNDLWTCSMHPQIKRTEPGDCPICGMDLIPTATTADGLSVNEFKLTDNAIALANIQTKIIGLENADASNSMQISGKIETNTDAIAIQPAHFNGRIENLYVSTLGETVYKGQAVAKVYSPELVAAQQELITAYKLKATQPQLYAAVQNKFKNWKIHEDELNSIISTGIIKTAFTIYSHVSGVVTELFVSDGGHIMDGDPIFKVANLQTVWANFDVYENQIEQFKLGQELKIISNAYSDKTFTGTVNFIDPIMDTSTRTVGLRVVLNNKAGLLKPGMFVQAELIATNAKPNSAVIIPASSVLWTGERSVVYVKTNPKTPTFEMREIRLGTKMGDLYEVVEGINQGDELVVNGTFTVDAAAQLQGKNSMMTASKTEQKPLSMEHLKRIETPIAFQNKFKEAYKLYTKLKDALMEERVLDVAKASSELTNKIDRIEASLLTDETAYSNWIQLKNALKEASIQISKTTDIHLQQTYFKSLSDVFIKMVQQFKINQQLYVAFCPMADGNTGAYWLADEATIKNPYFGGEMLTCGEVVFKIEKQ